MQQIIPRLKEYFQGARYASWWKAHVWVILTVPAILWWKDSIIFVILLSLFANYESSMAEYKGDLARKENAKESESGP